MDRADLKRLRFALLGLMGNGEPLQSQPPCKLSDSDWTTIDRLAAAHRLQPHLHGRQQRGELTIAIPEVMATHWRTAHRAQAMIALTQKRALLDADKVLREAGMQPIALKGAFLAWHSYPAAAERPMRDIDVLVAPDEVLHGFALLEKAGWHSDVTDRALLPEIAATQRHLPPLRNADGVWLELHGRAWDDGFADAATNLRSRAGSAVLGDPLHFPCPADMLTHLAIHAAHSHSFNVGPLLLADVDYLIATSEIDWPRFWDEAATGDYTRAAAAVLALTDRWRRPGLLKATQCPINLADDLPEDLLDDLSELLLQEPAARKDIALQSDLRRGWRETGAVGALKAKISADPRDGVVGRNASKPMRVMQAAKALADPVTRNSAAQSARIRSWLDA